MKLVDITLILMGLHLVLANSKENQFNCSANYTTTTSRILKTPTDFGKLTYLVGGSLSVSLNGFLLIIMACYPATRKAPQDIIITISINSFVQGFHFVIYGIYIMITDLSPSPFDAFCRIDGSLSSFGSTGVFLFGIGFAFSPLVIVNNSLKQSWVKFTTFLYVVVFSILTSFVIIINWKGLIDTTLNGDCYYQSEDQLLNRISAYLNIVFLVLIVVLACYSINRLKSSVPDNPQTRVKRRQYINYFSAYFIITLSIDWFQVILSNFIFISCFTLHLSYQYLLIDLNTLIIQTPSIVRPIIFLFDPKIRAALLEFSYTIKGNKLTSSTIKLLNKLSVEGDVLSELTNQIRTQSVYTSLAGIMLIEKSSFDMEDFIDDAITENTEYKYELDYRHSQSRVSFDDDAFRKQSMMNSYQFTKEDTKKCTTVFITPQTVKVIEGVDQEQILEMKVTLIAPKIFRYFQTVDYPMIDIHSSLDLNKNRERIKDFSAPDGGKSGEFFFFTWDNKLILKTLGQGELQSIKRRLEHYGNYLYNQQKSLIAKIYGIYTFQRLIAGQFQGPKVNLLMMANAQWGIPREFVTRTFDLKGSEYDREVLNQPTVKEIHQITLKDLDFFKLEKQIWIPKSIASEISRTLKRDANFFRLVRLIDYSLLVLKVDWGRQIKETYSRSGISTQRTNQVIDQIQTLTSRHKIIQSTFEDGIYYHMAIIDYLQEWNVNKGVEQATKKFIRMNTSLDTSAQNPDIYAQRFQHKLVDRIFLCNQI